MILYHTNLLSPWSLLWGIPAGFLAFLLHFVFLWLRRHKRPHVKALCHAHWHVLVGLIVALAVGFSLGVTVTRGLGLKYNLHLRIHPNKIEAMFGSQAPPSYSLYRYLPGVILDQGNTNACLAFAMTTARWVEDNIRGENLPDVFSGFYTYYWVTGGQNIPTSTDQEANSIIQHGLVLQGRMPFFGAPNQSIINSAKEKGGSLKYLFYNFTGQPELDAIKFQISHNIPVVLLIAVHDSFQNAFNSGTTWTDNTGNFIDYHAVLVYGYSGNNFYIRNSWGPQFGNNGNIVLTQYAMFHSVIGAVVITPSTTPAWPPAVPPIPPANPMTTPKSVAHGSSYVTVKNVSLHKKPDLKIAGFYLVRAGSRVKYLGKATPHWYDVMYNNRTGWVLRKMLK